MSFTLSELPYELDALSPHISKSTLSYHYGKHHQGYVNKLNAAIEKDASFQGKSLEELIKTAEGGLFNNAAQVWNHSFYWNCLSPDGGGQPEGALKKALEENFDSGESFQNEFTDKAKTLFGSGWVWLVKDKNDKLSIVTTKDAGNPLTNDQQPILTCDVWEHAYYLDYQNERPKYIEAFWNLINWEFVESQLQNVREAVAQ